MPIRLSCPRCQRAMQIDDRYAGRAVKCPGCATVLTAPAAAPAPASDNPFSFGGAAPGAGGGNAFDFDAPSPPVDEKFLAMAGPQIEAWRKTRAGLNLIWLGTGIQILAVTAVFFVAYIIFGTGAHILSTSQGDEPAPVDRRAAEKVAGFSLTAVVLGTVAIGTVVRLLGFFRCLATPSESGAKGLAIGALSCELLGLASSGGRIAADFLALPPISLALGLLSMLASLVGLVLLLLYLRQIGVALNCKELRDKVRNFVIWLGVGVVGFMMIAGGYVLLFLVAASGKPSAGARPLVLGLSCFPIAFVVIVGLIILLRYLGLFTTAADQIKRRVGK